MIFSNEQITAILWGSVVLMVLAYWLFGNSADNDEEEEIMDRDQVDENVIGQMKLDCLRLAQIGRSGADSTAIIADAQKFWDFILKSDETPDSE